MSRCDVLLIEMEAQLSVAVKRVGRAVWNMRQEMGGYPSRTPASGVPGGGKGGGVSVAIERLPGEPLRAPQDPAVREEWVRRQGPPPVSDAVAITGPELAALGFAGRDVARWALEELEVQVVRACDEIAVLAAAAGLERWPLPPSRSSSPVGRVVWAFGQVRRLRRVEELPTVPGFVGACGRASSAVFEVFRLCEVWGYTPGRPRVSREAVGLLAVDQTMRWCVSHLRLGVKRERQRPDVESTEPRSILCDWCYRHGPLLVPSWEAPPVELVRLHVDQGRVYAHQLDGFVAAERRRVKDRRKRRRR